MKTILCFGDSNTWGYMPTGEGRYQYEKRWTTILQQKLGRDYIVIPEGLNGRTTVFDDPIEGNKSGISHLPTLLESHKPIDVVILLLGTNDLKSRFGLNAYEISRGVERLVKLIKKSDAGVNEMGPDIILVSPPEILKSKFSCFNEESIAKSRLLSKHYSEVAMNNDVAFFDANEVVKSSPLDGIHWEEESHQKFGEAIAKKIMEIMKD